jgi:hypothetical protein
MPPLSGVIFDYAVARSLLNSIEPSALDVLARRVAAAGEPFPSFFEPRDLARELVRMGLLGIEDSGPEKIDSR